MRPRDSDTTTLIGDVNESQAQASGYQGGGDESVLLETAVDALKGLSKQ